MQIMACSMCELMTHTRTTKKLQKTGREYHTLHRRSKNGNMFFSKKEWEKRAEIDAMQIFWCARLLVWSIKFFDVFFIQEGRHQPNTHTHFSPLRCALNLDSALSLHQHRMESWDEEEKKTTWKSSSKYLHHYKLLNRKLLSLVLLLLKNGLHNLNHH